MRWSRYYGELSHHFYIVKFKFLSIAICLLMAAALVHAAPEDDQAGGIKRGSELVNLMQLGDQMKNSVGEKTNQMLGQAMTLLGVPYKRGGNTVETGFDCSGFVRHMYETSIGRLLPRRAEEQAAVTDKIDRNDLHPGDLVFFNTMRRTFSHVGIYIGDGKFIHSPSSGKSVRVDDLRAAYWTKRFTGARRVQETPPADNTNR
ncbi:C40 family peptidase [Limnohabitans sp. T6-20]|uniref:C40 family peptidase n=1 Tax=Limnohabitans sp. T6-20 TaxID=1100725 RepID=UPI000DD1F472|nr:C40 family peptidase [Limnohabitans sp. T6-20]PUE12767.1 glycoside hydrolase [Limnohabitans sp. T6-20]